MRIFNEANEYLNDWYRFRNQCEEKAKGKCHLNSSCYKKLQEFHLETYLGKVKSPFGFLYKTKLWRPDIYRTVWCMPKYYYKELNKRKELFDEIQRGSYSAD